MAILKKIEGNELYLYMNGKLIYKRWLDTGQSFVFDIIAYDKYTHTSIRDIQYENSDGLILVKARLKMKSTEDGGRNTGFTSGYRPNHVFEYTNGKLSMAYIGDVLFDGKSTFDPGEEGLVTVRFMMNQPLEQYLHKGRVWWLHEGAKQIGEAEILNIL